MKLSWEATKRYMEIGTFVTALGMFALGVAQYFTPSKPTEIVLKNERGDDSKKIEQDDTQRWSYQSYLGDHEPSNYSGMVAAPKHSRAVGEPPISNVELFTGEKPGRWTNAGWAK